jgi:hypothetical protein
MMKSLVIGLSLLVATLAAGCGRPQQPASTAAPATPNSANQPSASSPNGRIGGVVQGVSRGTVALQDGKHFALSPDNLIIH